MGDATVALEGEGVSWADTGKIAKTETIKAQQHTVRVVMRGLSSRLIFVGQAHRLPGSPKLPCEYGEVHRWVARDFPGNVVPVCGAPTHFKGYNSVT
jgi:hypothetical protein